MAPTDNSKKKQELREFYDSFYKIPKEDRGAVPVVFITYFLIGKGIFKFLYVLKGYTLVSKLTYLLKGLFTLGLVFFNINDSII